MTQDKQKPFDFKMFDRLKPPVWKNSTLKSPRAPGCPPGAAADLEPENKEPDRQHRTPGNRRSVKMHSEDFQSENTRVLTPTPDERETTRNPECPGE